MKYYFYCNSQIITIDNSRIRVTSIMAIKVGHQAVLVITFEHISNANGGSIQPTPILPGGIFTCNKANMTSLGAISFDGVTGELICHHHPHWRSMPTP